MSQEIEYFVPNPAAVDIIRDAVLTLKGAYVMLPPKAVLRDVDRFEWSPAGTRMLAITHSQKDEVDAALEDLLHPPPVGRVGYLAVVDAKTMKTRWVSGIENPLDPDLSISWPDNGEFCVVQGTLAESDKTKPPVYVHYLVDLATGAARGIPLDNPSDDVFLAPFDKGRTLMYIFPARLDRPSTTPNGVASRRTQTFVLDARGQVTASPPGLDKATSAGWEVSSWSPQLGIVLAKASGDFAVLLPSGEVQPLARQVLVDANKLQRERVGAVEPHLLLTEKRARQGRETWLVARPDAGPQPAALVCALTEHSGLSPRLDAVAYTSQRMLWIRPMVFIDGELAVLIREKVYRQEMMMKAKQIAPR